MANTSAGVVNIAGASANPDENRKLYDDWGENYEKDVRAWGYDMPEVVAKMLRKHAPEGAGEKYAVLDAGAGDGLSGKALVAEGFKDVIGIDLSPELVKIANQKEIYRLAEVGDLSKPLKYKADQFDALTIVGVMTYLEPDSCVLDEFCRVVKTGGLVIMTHRTDKVDKWTPRLEAFVSEGRWEKVEVTEPLPYLPNNPEYGDKIKVHVHVYRVCRKGTVDMKVTSKRGVGFYITSAKGLLQGVAGKDGTAKEPVDTLKISGLGDAISIAAAAAAACQTEDLATISKVETGYQDMKSAGGSIRGCPGITITLKRK